MGMGRNTFLLEVFSRRRPLDEGGIIQGLHHFTMRTRSKRHRGANEIVEDSGGPAQDRFRQIEMQNRRKGHEQQRETAELPLHSRRGRQCFRFVDPQRSGV
jgi:hypothetical protein